MCKYCSGEVDLYEELGSYARINSNKEIGKFLEFSDHVGNVMCIKINFCPVCGADDTIKVDDNFKMVYDERHIFDCEGIQKIKIKSVNGEKI